MPSKTKHIPNLNGFRYRWETIDCIKERYPLLDGRLYNNLSYGVLSLKGAIDLLAQTELKVAGKMHMSRIIPNL